MRPGTGSHDASHRPPRRSSRAASTIAPAPSVSGDAPALQRSIPPSRMAGNADPYLRPMRGAALVYAHVDLPHGGAPDAAVWGELHR